MSFEKFQSKVLPLERSNVDTDQIIPKQYLKSIYKDGYGDFLFDNWRYLDEGDLNKSINERTINSDFVLNDDRYKGSKILLAGENFGCGSSREHAVWALVQYGFKCVISPFFSDIFYGNAFKNQLLLIQLEADIVDILFQHASKNPLSLEVSLKDQKIICEDLNETYDFDIPQSKKNQLLQGWDDIDLTLQYEENIQLYEKEMKSKKPWLF